MYCFNVIFLQFPSMPMEVGDVIPAHAFLTHAILVVFFLAAAYRRRPCSFVVLCKLQLAASCVPFMRTLRIYERSRCLLRVGFVGFLSAADDLLSASCYHGAASAGWSADSALGARRRRASFEEFFFVVHRARTMAVRLL